MMLTSTAMAQTYTDAYGVKYEMTNVSSIEPTQKTASNIYMGTENLTQSKTTTYSYSGIKATATEASDKETIIFESGSFSTNSSTNNTYTRGSNEYMQIMKNIAENDDNYAEYNDVPDGSTFNIRKPSSGDYFYITLQEDEEGQYYSCILIKNVVITETIINNYTYSPAAIAAGLIDSNTNTKAISIASTITSIAPGAFKGCTSLINISNNSSAFTVEDNILYNAAKTTVIAAGAGVTGTITLPSSVTTVYDYAFANCSNLTVITTATAIGGNQGSTTRIGSENSIFDESDLKITQSGNGLIVTGEVASSNINNIWGDYTKSSICYVDFTGSTVHGSVTITNNENPNCLFFFKAGDKASGTNVVVGEKCATMTFNENENYGFHSPYQFTVTGTTKYTRAAALTAGQWSTVCLPFRGTSTNGLTFGYLKSFNNNNLTFLKTTDSRVEGGIIMAENGGTSFTFSDVIVPITNSSNQYTKSVDGVTSVGNLIATNYSEAAATFPGNNIYTVSGGKLVICSGTVQWRAYRAYFAISQSSKAPAMRVEEEDGNIVELGTAIDLIEVAPKVEVNIASIEGGLSLTTQEAGRVTVYSMDGKKMFDGIVEGSKNLLLNKGIYAINNKKVIVK